MSEDKKAIKKDIPKRYCSVCDKEIKEFGHACDFPGKQNNQKESLWNSLQIC